MGCSSFLINDKAYIVGGSTSSSQTKNEVWEYDITNDSWKKKNNLPFEGTWRGNGFSISDTVYVCNGVMANGAYLREMYRYDQLQDSWSVLNITLPDRKYSACAVIGRKACFYGGTDSLKNFTNDFRTYHPDEGYSSAYSGFAVARKGGMAFTLDGYFIIPVA
ncbi:MAG: kelch repeat-containing protein [Flavobacteriales bacterium]